MYFSEEILFLVRNVLFSEAEVCTQSKACGACWGRGAAIRGRMVLMSSILSSTPKE